MILTRLARVIAIADPVPQAVQTAALAAFTDRRTRLHLCALAGGPVSGSRLPPLIGIDRNQAIVTRGGVMRLLSRTGLIATALMIGVIAAPSAFADPSHSGWNPATSWVVRPNPDHQAGELAPPAGAHNYSSARVVSPNPDAQFPQVTSSRDGLGEAQLRAAFTRAVQPDGRNNVPTSTSPPSTVRQPTISGSQGFQLDDAAVGAGAMVGLTLLGLGATFALRRRTQLLHS